MIVFENEQEFFDWLQEVLKEESAECLENADRRRAWLDDVEKQAGNICAGSPEYSFWFEVPSHQTKSKNPECYSVDVVNIEDANGDFDTKIIF